MPAAEPETSTTPGGNRFETSADEQRGPRQVQVGIDTGGTFTDAAALVRRADGSVEVLATAKSLTTKGDLSLGVIAALGTVANAISSQGSNRIELISVSTTLATNAVVEGHGDKIGVVLIGFDKRMTNRIGITEAFPDTPICALSGGHNHAGFEQAPLDLDGLDRFLATAPADLQAFAVCSVFAVRNPEHERLAAERIAVRTGRPVTMSSELTGALDAIKRTSTAVLNARLVGRISRLLAAVDSARTTLGLECPVFVVKGDGTQARAESIRFRPIETVMSGPAASTIGAAALSGLADSIMSDVGGTTTDVAVLRNGRPSVRDDGATVGGWNTLVRAADIRTYGLGGDSEVHAESGRIVVGPQRVVPVALLADRWPKVLDFLEMDLLASEFASAAQGRFVAVPFGAESEVPDSLTMTETEMVAAVLDGPRPERIVASSARAQRVLQSLVKRGVLVRSALSVADAAHVTHRQTLWSREAAVLASRLFARVQMMRDASEADAAHLAESILDAAITQSGLAIFDSALGFDSNSAHDSQFLRGVAAGQQPQGVTVSISPRLPIVAVGGPAPLLYPEVGRRLGTPVVLTEHGAVANAIGAALGPISVEVRVDIEHTSDAFRLVSTEAASSHADLSEALAVATALAESTASARCNEQGATTVDVTIERDLVYLPGRTDDAGLLSATIVARATGLPRTTSRLQNASENL